MVGPMEDSNKPAIWRCPYCKDTFEHRHVAELHIRQRHAKQVNCGYERKRRNRTATSGLFDSSDGEVDNHES